MLSMQSTSSMAPSSPISSQRSPWHSPVPYLFGGLAAMLGLIAFALLILACSYWKLSGYQHNHPDPERDLESGDHDINNDKTSAVLEEKYLVIMAGQVNPTFLATPISSRASSFGSRSGRSNSTDISSSTLEMESDQLQVRGPGVVH
ncbi:putative protein glutamine dumper [Helianthus annuus]|nr:putative protein glutamine dumper [Helianthus annuus]KAJ0749331.1 putative protein glutamine dumper [Helianthus annuus]KAJ0921594.1 putative protein glutamine dumper [Helianthus annuus]